MKAELPLYCPFIKEPTTLKRNSSIRETFLVEGTLILQIPLAFSLKTDIASVKAITEEVNEVEVELKLYFTANFLDLQHTSDSNS